MISLQRQLRQSIQNILRPRTLNKESFSMFDKLFNEIFSLFLARIKDPIQKNFWKKQKDIYRNKLRSKIAKRINKPTNKPHVFRTYPKPKPHTMKRKLNVSKITINKGFAASTIH